LYIQLFGNLESFITLCTELAAFSHGNLAVETLSKIISTIQDSTNIKCEHFF